jgi:hypothetical protein
MSDKSSVKDASNAQQQLDPAPGQCPRIWLDREADLLNNHIKAMAHERGLEAGKARGLYQALGQLK